MRRFIYGIISMAVALHSCNMAGFTPKEGDLLFCVAEGSDFSNAITNVTAYNDSLQFDHVAMVVYENNCPFVIEASSKKGVSISSLNDFLTTATHVNGKIGVVVKRIAIDFSAIAAAEKARNFMGEPYDWSFLPDNGKMYCSELIYECYRNDDNTPLFTSKPMTFKDANGNIPQFWIDLFQSHDETIPEGIQGTNPNDMAKSPILIEVHRYF